MKRIRHVESTYTEVGKIIASKRLQGETLGAMSKKLGFNASYLGSIMYGRRPLSFSVYELLCKNYVLSEKEKTVMKAEILTKPICERAIERLGEKVSYDDLLYVFYGVEKC